LARSGLLFCFTPGRLLHPESSLIENFHDINSTGNVI
jgi:hypothetical protein